jgi:transposase InsO family protein
LAYHNTSINGAHFGKDRTYYKIRDRYFWPNMYNDIAQHVKACPNCTVNKHSRRKPDGHLRSVAPPEGVWQNLAMDFVGPITPASSTGNRYILVVTDLLSKFAVTKATRDNSALTAAKMIVEDVILKYGAPNQLLTDNGTHFTAELFNAIMDKCGVCHVLITPYQPQSNGACERFNATMCGSLAAICNKKRTDWDQQLSKTTFAYNTSRHVSTKLTPFEMMHGRTCKLPFDLPKKKTTIVEQHEYVKHLHDYLETAKQMAKETIEHRQQQSKQRHDASRRDQIYSIGDFVFVKRLGMNEKFAPKYDGPYQIIGKINDLVYRVQNPNDLNDTMRIHVNRTRQCHSIPSNN